MNGNFVELNRSKLEKIKIKPNGESQLYRSEIKKNSNTFWYQYFDSMKNMLDYCTNKSYNYQPDSSVSKSEGGGKWNQFGTWEEALKCARSGWAKGVGLIKDVGVSLSSDSVGERVIRHNVHGDMLDMGRVMSGHPECWMHEDVLHDGGVGGRIKKIGFNYTYSCSVSTDVIYRRGAVAMAIVDTLEKMGFRCELTAFVLVDVPLMYETIIKRPEDPLNLNNVAFALCNPDMLRRIYFRAMEAGTSFGAPKPYGYGAPVRFSRFLSKNDFESNYDLMFDSQAGNLKKKYGTDEKARKTMAKMLEPYLTDFNIDELNLNTN